MDFWEVVGSSHSGGFWCEVFGCIHIQKFENILQTRTCTLLVCLHGVLVQLAISMVYLSPVLQLGPSAHYNCVNPLSTSLTMMSIHVCVTSCVRVHCLAWVRLSYTY